MAGDYPRRADDDKARLHEDIGAAARHYKDGFDQSDDPLIRGIRDGFGGIVDVGRRINEWRRGSRRKRRIAGGFAGPQKRPSLSMSDDKIRCLVTGATGYIGGRLVPELLDRGYDVRALARNPDKLADVPWRDRAEVVRGDLDDADSLTAAFDGIDVVYYLVHSMGTSPDFVDQEAQSARNVVAAARRAGVKRLVYLGGLHPRDADLSPHLRSRTAVGEILLESGIETVVLQAGIVVGSGSASFEMIRHLTDRLPVMTTPKWVHNKIQPIAIDDVLHYLAEAATATVPSVADLGHRRAGRTRVRRGDAGLRRGGRSAATVDRRDAVADTDYREFVGGSGHTDPVWTGAAVGRIVGMRCGDGRARHRRVHTAARRRSDRLPRCRRACVEVAVRCPATHDGHTLGARCAR